MVSSRSSSLDEAGFPAAPVVTPRATVLVIPEAAGAKALAAESRAAREMMVYFILVYYLV